MSHAKGCAYRMELFYISVLIVAILLWRAGIAQATEDDKNSADNLYNRVMKAKEYFAHAVEIQLKTLGEEHPDTAKSFKNLGLVYRWLGDYAHAKKYHERALVIRLKALGEYHADTAASLNDLGAVYGKLGDYGKPK
jgi:tetratricopeptide (TPR) repeat protein